MNRFKNIGVVYDLENPSADVLAHAKELVTSNNASIHLLCVAPYDISAVQKEVIAQSLRDMVGFDFSLTYVTENPVVDITHYSIKHGLDMVLIGNDEEEGLINHFFHGSLALSLMRKAPCPIWVAKRPAATTYKRVLIAVDPVGNEDHPIDPSLNRKLIEIGTSYAQRHAAECYLVTAWRLEGEGMMSGPFVYMPPEEIERLKDEEKARYAKAFEQLQKQHSDALKGCETCMLYGEPGIAIPKFVAEKQIDLIVMGTLARTGIQGFLIGNTAESIINQVNCSIMAIKPDGFVSPLAP